MKFHRFIAAVFMAILALSTSLSASKTQAQSAPLFEGTIAYIDSNGNVVIVNGKGGVRQITSDASREDWIYYSEPTFSPDGRYLAFASFDRSKLIIYDIGANSIAGEYKHNSSADFLQWHRDSDSFIFAPSHTNDPNPANVDCLRDYYRQFLSGEQSLIYSLWKSDNGFNINFDLDTIVYTTGISCGGNEMGVVIENWATGTKYSLPNYVDLISTVGIWTPDGRYYIKDDLAEDSRFLIVDLQSGEIVKTINIKELIPEENGNSLYTNAEYIDTSSDSRHLLVYSSGNLYDVDIDTLTTRHIYKHQYLNSFADPYDAYLSGNWSASGNLVMVYEDDPQNRVFNNYTDITVASGGQSIPVAKNAIPFFWIKNSVDRFLYAKNEFAGQMIYPTLMIYDHGSQTSTQISALLPLESEYPVTTSLVDWTAAEFDLPQGLQTTDSTTPVPPSSAPSTDNGQQNPINTNPLGGFSNLLYCLLCLLLLIILAALAVFLFSRRRKTKDAREEKQEHTEYLPPSATSADQIKKAIELSKSKRHKEAFEILRGVIQAEPNNMSAWFNLGGVLASMGNYKDAERAYEHAKQLGHPRGDDALNWLKLNRQ